MLKFAANLSFLFNEHSFSDRFAAAADCGFQAVEYLFPYEFSPDVIAENLRKHGLTQALFNLPPGDWQAGDRGLAALEGREAEFDRSVATALEYAEATGVKRMHVMAGIADSTDPAAARVYSRNIAAAADAAAEKGLGILIEPINAGDLPGYFLNDFRQAVRIIKELARPNLQLQFDIYHRQIIHGDVLTALEQLFPLIGHVQIAAVPRRTEPNTGELNDDRIFAFLQQLGYQGYIGCEYKPARSTREGLAWLSPYLIGSVHTPP
jgi:2-dehydrotetronate isomerase